MHHIKSTSLFSALIIGAVFTATAKAADFKASGYETPAYVDVEFSEMQVNEPAGRVEINIFRSGDFRQTTTIEYQTAEDSATEGQDYKASGGTLVFKPGEGFKTVVLEVLADDEEELRESFQFHISSSDPNAMLMRTAVTVSINDSPVPIQEPRLEIASAGAGNIRLSWEGAAGSTLERTTNPGSGVWEPVNCSPEVDVTRCHVLQPCGGTFYFYRLRTE